MKYLMKHIQLGKFDGQTNLTFSEERAKTLSCQRCHLCCVGHKQLAMLSKESKKIHVWYSDN